MSYERIAAWLIDRCRAGLLVNEGCIRVERLERMIVASAGMF